MAKTYTSLDPYNLGRTVVIWVYVQIGAEVLQAAAYAYTLTPAGSVNLPDGLTAGDLFVSFAALIFLVAYFIGGFLGLKWIYRVNRNAHSFVRGLSNTPPWAVGWFFVPIAALWKPYEAMGEVWQASERPQRWRTAPKPSFLGWWWAAWLVSSIVGNISGLMARYIEDVRSLAPIMIIGAALSVAADVLFIRVVKGLSSLQRTQITFGVFDASDEAATGAPDPATGAAAGSSAGPIVS